MVYIGIYHVYIIGMAKRAFLIHGWAGSPDEGWRPWLKTELEKRGFRVFALNSLLQLAK